MVRTSLWHAVGQDYICDPKQSSSFEWAKWRFPKKGVPQNGWFIRENPSKNGWFGGTPFFWETTTWMDMIWLWIKTMVPWVPKSRNGGCSFGTLDFTIPRWHCEVGDRETPEEHSGHPPPCGAGQATENALSRDSLYLQMGLFRSSEIFWSSIMQPLVFWDFEQGFFGVRSLGLAATQKIRFGWTCFPHMFTRTLRLGSAESFRTLVVSGPFSVSGWSGFSCELFWLCLINDSVSLPCIESYLHIVEICTGIRVVYVCAPHMYWACTRI